MNAPRASGMGVISECPGSFPLSATLPQDFEERECGMATMGTKLHACMAAEDPYEHGVALGLGDWELSLLGRAVDWEETVLATFKAERGDELLTEAEHAFPPIRLEGVPEHLWPTGHADRLVWTETAEHGLVLDFKFGPLPLERQILAPQLLTYAAGMLSEFPQMKAVEVVAFHAGEDKDFYEVVNRSDLPAILDRLTAVILATQDPAPLFRPGRLQCQHCRARSICNVAVRECRQLVQWAGRPLAERSGEEKAELLGMAKLAAATATAVIDAMKGELQVRPDSVPGWRLKERSTRSIENPAAVANAVDQWVSAQDLLGTARPSITKLEALFAERYVEAEGGTKKDAKQILSKLIEPHMGRETSYILERDPEFKAIAPTNGDTP